MTLKISIIEPIFSGHVYTYVRHIAEAAKRVGADYRIHCTSIGQKSAEFKNHLGHIPKEHIEPSLEPTGTGRFSIYRQINRLIEQVTAANPDTIVYPTADFAAIAAGIGRLSGRDCLKARNNLCMMTKLGFSYPGIDKKVVEWVDQAGLYLSSWDQIGIIDAVAYERLHKKNHSIAKRLRLYPDPISVAAISADKKQCRKKLGWDLNKHIFLCPGVLRRGKGIPKLVEGFLKLPVDKNACLIFAGPLRDGVKQVFQTTEVQTAINAGRIIVDDRSLSEQELGMVMTASDITCCVYPRQNHPSSIAVTALAYNRPVLHSNVCWLGEIGPRFQFGFSCDPADPNSIAEALLESIGKTQSWVRSPQVDRLLKFQSADNFIAHWEDTFRSIDSTASTGSVASSAIQWSSVDVAN